MAVKNDFRINTRPNGGTAKINKKGTLYGPGQEGALARVLSADEKEHLLNVGAISPLEDDEVKESE